MYILRAYAGNDNATVDVNNWRRNFFLFFLHLHLAKEVIWNNREKDWKSTSSCFIIKKLFFLPLSWGIDAWRRKNYLRLRAVSLFSVVRRAERETRKWPRAWLMARDGRVTKKERLPAKPETMVFHGLVIFRRQNWSVDRPGTWNVTLEFAWTTEVFILFLLNHSLCSA